MYSLNKIIYDAHNFRTINIGDSSTLNRGEWNIVWGIPSQQGSFTFYQNILHEIIQVYVILQSEMKH